jgi:hypothetical protein
MTIRTNPPGALVYVDDNEIGISPCSTNFIYYGSRKIRIVKDGFETLTTLQYVPPPWYEIPPLDFVSENFVAGRVNDQRTFDYQLRPQGVVPTDQLLDRAEALRHGSQTSAASVATPVVPGVRVNPPPRGPVELPPRQPEWIPPGQPGPMSGAMPPAQPMLPAQLGPAPGPAFGPPPGAAFGPQP